MKGFFFIIFICSFLWATSSLVAQSSNGLVLELTSGIEAGWWVYNRGSVDPNNFNDQGWDRSHYVVEVPIGIGVLYGVGKWKVGVTAAYSFFFDDEMEQFEDSYFLDREYKISDGTVKFLSLKLHTEYAIFSREGYQLAPSASLGTFQIESLHPEKENFGKKFFWEFGLANELKISNMVLLIKPQYQNRRINPKSEKNVGEQHNIFNLGIIVGVRLFL